jgi:hypothetical protein
MIGNDWNQWLANVDAPDISNKCTRHVMQNLSFIMTSFGLGVYVYHHNQPFEVWEPRNISRELKLIFTGSRNPYAQRITG